MSQEHVCKWKLVPNVGLVCETCKYHHPISPQWIANHPDSESWPSRVSDWRPIELSPIVASDKNCTLVGYREAIWQRHTGRGPGDYLKAAIKSQLGEEPIETCKCASRIRIMNQFGLSRCRAEIGMIVGWLEEEAKQRRWLDRLKVWANSVKRFATCGASDSVRNFINEALDECAATYPKMQAFYHVACMNGEAWKPIVLEQMALFNEVGVTPVACVLGTEADAEWVREQGAVVQSVHPSMAQFETPTLQAMWEWCRENPDGYAMYVHSKGASQPGDDRRRVWRQLMGYYVIGDWPSTIDKLKNADVAGVSWLDRHWHFSGNFFMARADWINKLPSPLDHRYKLRPPGDNGTWDRLGCELWIGSNHSVRVASLCGRNKWVAGGRLLWKLLADKIADRQNTKRPVVHASHPTPSQSMLTRPAVIRALQKKNSVLRKRLVG